MQIKVSRLRPAQRFKTVHTGRDGVVCAWGHTQEGARRVWLDSLRPGGALEQKVLHPAVVVEVEG